MRTITLLYIWRVKDGNVAESGTFTRRRCARGDGAGEEERGDTPRKPSSTDS
ncbi:hypothetical protein NPIL_254541, partial [Nephila pilipes]